MTAGPAAALEPPFTLTVPGTDDLLRLHDGALSHGEMSFSQLDHGIWDLLPAATRAALDTFAHDYSAVRAAEGHELTPAAIRALPDIDPNHPLAHMWSERRASWERVRQELRDRAIRAGTMIDIGAGCGWLSARMTSDGWRCAAIDATVAGGDGLAAARHHPADLLLIRGDMGALPFARDSVDLAVFNASVHYAADIGDTLRQAQRVVRPGGIIVVMDSPVFENPAAGHQMVREFKALTQASLGLSTATHQGPGFLTWADLAPFGFDQPDLANTRRLKATVTTRFHRWRGARRAGRETAQRPLLIAQSPTTGVSE